MDYVANSHFTGTELCQTTLLTAAVSVRKTPILGTVLYDEHSHYRRLRPYLPIEADFPPIFARHIPQAVLTNELIVHRGNTIFVESSIHSAASNGAKDPEILTNFAGRLRESDGVVDQRYTDVSAMVFHNEGGGTWGHFIVQNLPRALLYLEKFPDGKIIVPRVHAFPDGSNFNRSLTRLGVPQDRLIPIEQRGSYQFRELVLVDFLYNFPKLMPHPLALELLATRAGAVDPATPGRSIFLSRIPGQGRSIDNGAEVEAVLDKHGVHTTVLGHQNFEAQIAAWQHSDLIVSTLGSDLTNIVFGKAGSRILALSPDWFGDAFFYHLAILKDMQWNELRCGTRVQQADVSHKASFRVDTDILDAMLATLAK